MASAMGAAGSDTGATYTSTCLIKRSHRLHEERTNATGVNIFHGRYESAGATDGTKFRLRMASHHPIRTAANQVIPGRAELAEQTDQQRGLFGGQVWKTNRLQLKAEDSQFGQCRLVERLSLTDGSASARRACCRASSPVKVTTQCSVPSYRFNRVRYISVSSLDVTCFDRRRRPRCVTGQNATSSRSRGLRIGGRRLMRSGLRVVSKVMPGRMALKRRAEGTSFGSGTLRRASYCSTFSLTFIRMRSLHVVELHTGDLLGVAQHGLRNPLSPSLLNLCPQHPWKERGGKTQTRELQQKPPAPFDESPVRVCHWEPS